MFDNKKVAFYTLGCKLNFSETSTIGRQVVNIGVTKTEFENKADNYLDFSETNPFGEVT